MHARISDRPLAVEAIAEQAVDDRSGAVVTFTGVVRDHDAGRRVTAIDYSAHPQAESMLAGLVEECALRDGVHGAAAAHRVGHLEVGDLAMVVAVSAEHRGEAFAAASDLVDAVKAGVPVWKCQWMADGSHEWSGLP
ncbi:molybdenum cofactor biosynthesis protein MoaE [Acidipropionibacterium virtanenii]|uniref:Molybdopterin synthase catalytic subunit 2 n=1 Tax=Acidipropionibacterium virtanenii TaxID=2057246 RepID=A0A344UY13_9ACTN|nr:molybdenum cofactor biosynthesis protein MoaE [Acidipropionibacterium virtanenii]AXE40161.1 Molybdopterin synthase catalytic subunit 2 [Acidipropionibacterium virtanenii]